MTEESPAIAPMKTKAKVPLAPVRTPVIQSVWTWFWVALLAACIPMLVIYFSRMWRLDHYQYFPFAIGAVAWLAWSRSDRYFYAPSRISSLLLISVGVLAMIGSWSLRSPWMMSIAFVCYAAACLSVMRGPHDKSLLILALPLLLLIRLPLGYDQLLVIQLQHLTTMMSSLLLDVLSIPHAVTRNVIELPSRELFVAEACSGIQSVFTMAFLSTLIVAINRRKLWLAPFYLFIALILAAGGNVLRVTMVAVADQWMSLDLASGWAHDILGYTTLAISAFFLWSFDGMIMTLMHVTGTTSDEQPDNPVLHLWNWFVDDGQNVDAVGEYYRSESIFIENKLNLSLSQTCHKPPPLNGKLFVFTAGLFGAVLLTISTAFAMQVRSVAIESGARGRFTDYLILKSPDDHVRSAGNSYSLFSHHEYRENENPLLGRNADTWEFHAAIGLTSIDGKLVASQTFRGWHELCLCYEAQDWSLLHRFSSNAEQTERDETTTPNIPFAFGLFGRENGSRGHLWYTAITQSGDLVHPPERLGQLGKRFSEPDISAIEPMMMLQLWVVAPQKLDASTIDRIDEMFDGLRQKIATAVKAANGSSAIESDEQAEANLEVSS
ncbi:exosortase U [Rhodopirellula europaea]|uniref:Membrane protein containing Exosortase, EpsH, 8 transmembrane domain protein n=1 Tax=Rhodopirellula europaea SH398 TaxID=1263868 RepID=M5RZK3_9BACT|nr:exosortase U [Rhodopirellula europaea]EMI24740.1 membrane protein containing Exosortase, EpsH, 8 transmembrane domain protein [Rhodopirellula europaea SH398]